MTGKDKKSPVIFSHAKIKGIKYTQRACNWTFAVFMFLHCSCIDLKKTDTPSESVAGLPKVTTTRIDRINACKKNMRILSLPFRANYDSTARGTYRWT